MKQARCLLHEKEMFTQKWDGLSNHYQRTIELGHYVFQVTTAAPLYSFILLLLKVINEVGQTVVTNSVRIIQTQKLLNRSCRALYDLPCANSVPDTVIGYYL